MEQDLQTKLDEQDKKLQAIWHSVEQTRKYFLWMLIASAVLFILPLLGLLIAIPQLISIYRTTATFNF
jgi:hypothetical protein